jgi:hypothetical protein
LRKRSAALLTFVLVLSVAASARSERKCAGGRGAQSAMWYSILHPGLGEYYLKGWGPFPNAPQKKFWLGFIPFYGWPGYLQYKSAKDASNCLTNDEI